jgi:hypothetical protein
MATMDSGAEQFRETPPPRRPGAPKGNRNALKHGFHSGKRRDFDSGLRNFLRRLDAMCNLAGAMANANAGRAR